MKKKLAVFLLALIVPIMALTGCSCVTKNIDYKTYSESRFIFVGKYETIYDGDGNSLHIHLLVDKETRIIYLYTGYDGGITPLLDKNGNVSYYTGSLLEE